MKSIARSIFPVLFVLATHYCTSTSKVFAEEALFIGNSFTFGAGSKGIQEHGGVPKLVEVIAAAKGKSISTHMLTVGGKDFAFHLKQPKTDENLKLKKWNRVVLQGYSLEATHLGKPEEFSKNGEIFYRRIRETSPNAKIVLYETWARATGHQLYSGTSTPQTFLDPAEMNREVQDNYTKLAQLLESLEPGTQVELAPVGLAFARCLEKYPDLVLHSSDKYHASSEGSYLAALVLYATIFQDSPAGAPHEFFGVSLKADVATKLQEIATDVTKNVTKK